MSYNLKEKSLYKVFGTYDEKLCKKIFDAFKTKEEFSYRLLEKKYGSNLDGKGTIGVISYMENSRIQNIISRLNSWFIYADYLYKEKNESLDSIYKLFAKTKDEKLVAILSSYQKSKEEKTKQIANKREIMKLHNISEQELSDALAFVKNSNYRISYKYTYGIGCSKMHPDEILDLLKIKKEEYRHGIIVVQNELSSLIQQSKKLKDQLSVPKKTIKIPKQNDSKKEKPLVKEVASIKENRNIENRRKRKERFIEYFYTEGMSVIEKKEIETKLVEVLPYLKKKSKKGYALCQKLYGDDLDSSLSDYRTSTSENTLFTNFINSAKRYIKNGIKEQKVKNEIVLKNNFIEYFYEDNISEEEKNKILINLEKALQLYSGTKSYQVFKKIYNDEYMLNNNIKLATYDKRTIMGFVKNLKKYIYLDLKKIPLKEKKKSFFEYFYDKTMTEDEKEKLKDEILKIVEYLKIKGIKGYNEVVLLYGANICGERKNIELTPEQKSNINNFKYAVRKYIGKEIPDACIDKYISYSRRPHRFVEYFYKYGSNKEDKLEIQKRVEEILEIEINSKLKGVKIAQSLYGEKLDQNSNNIKLSNNDKCLFRNFVERIKNILDGKINSESIKYQKARRKKDTFFEYFYTEDMNEVEKYAVNKKVLQFISEHSKCVAINIIYKLYGPNLNELNNIALTCTENSNLSSFRREIRLYLDNNGRKNKAGRSRPSTFFEYFYDDSINKIEKQELDIKITEILETKKGLKCYSSLVAVYGEDYKALQSNYDKKENTGIIFLVKTIKNELNKFFEKKQSVVIETGEANILSANDSEIIEQSNEVIDVIEYAKKCNEDINLSYLDSLMLKLHNESFDENEIVKILTISENDIVDFYIRNLHLFDLEYVLDYILNNHLDRIKNLLESDYFLPFREQLTKKEQELIYLKLLSKINKDLTDDVISIITDLPINEVIEYEIMTKDDTFNSLNEYIKTSFIKKEYKKIKHE